MRRLDKELSIEIFKKIKQNNPESSLDQILYEAFEYVKENDTDSFEEFRKEILEANDIDEFEYYTKNVNVELKRYIEKKIFPEYEKNDQGHGILHIREVIRRSFALRDTLKLDLDDNMIYAIAACHDLGKYEERKDGRRKTCEYCSKKILSRQTNG